MILDRHGISAKVIADSVYQGSRLTTIEATFPRFLLAEVNTHRILSRSSASSRAEPVWKKLARVVDHPYVPMHFGMNKAGMQSKEMVSDEDNRRARQNWLLGRDIAIMQALMLAGGEAQIIRDAKGDPRAVDVCRHIANLRSMFPNVAYRLSPLSVGVHKQHANRVLEPYAWHTTIITGTAWRNMYALRASAETQPEYQELAIAMARVHQASVPRELQVGEWHLPYVVSEDAAEVKDQLTLASVSAARCARISYLTHDGLRVIKKDLGLSGDLRGEGHMSPFEHQATPRDKRRHRKVPRSNFNNCWVQHRKLLPSESDFSKLISREKFLEGMRGDEALVDFVLSLPE